MSGHPLNGAAQRDLVEHARAAYTRRATIRRYLKHTNTDIHQLLTEHIHTNPDLGALTVRSALADLPGLGDHHVTVILTTLGIDGTRRLRGLGPHEATALANQLDAR